MKFPIILIDNGHGKDTPGKCSPDKKYREYSWTREIASRLQIALQEAGITAFLLVKEEEEDIALSERVAREHAFCRRYGTANVLLVSIHSNAAGNSGWMNARGWSIWTSVGNTKADDFATEIYAAAVKVLPEGLRIRKDMSDGDPDYEKQFYILRKTLCPAVLTENFFHDNVDDLAFITSEEGKKAVVDLHVLGIKRYIENHFTKE